MSTNVNLEIAFTHIRTRKRQTLVASMGVTVGIALYILSNTMVSGFSAFSRSEMFKSVPHIRVYRDNEVSQPLFEASKPGSVVVITNPKLISRTPRLNNPDSLLATIRRAPYVTAAAPQVVTDLFYLQGSTRLRGMANGVDIFSTDALFNISSTMVAGSIQALNNDPNSIILGQGIATRMNLQMGDYISLLSAQGVRKSLRVVGIFRTGNKDVDESRSYIQLATARQLEKQDASFVTDIYARLRQPDSATEYAADLQTLTPYKVEDWKTAYADQLARDSIAGAMTPIISISIMMVAAFGIYNILNLTITQKMNDIAILKANGFKGKHIVRIFVTEALIMGLVGTLLGLSIGAALVGMLQNLYIGEPVGYFPVSFDPGIFTTAAVFGMVVSLSAGYLPARKAGKVDPVAIFRK